MASDQRSIERLRTYLAQLSPKAQLMLMREFERAAERGDEVAVANCVLTELRKLIREDDEANSVGRNEEIVRMLFRPIEPFLVDIGAARLGRVRRGSLLPVWNWLKGHVLPAETQLFETAMIAALRDGEGSAEQIVRGYQHKAAEAISEIASSSSRDAEKQRLKARLASTEAVEDLVTIGVALKNREVVEALAARLPRLITNFGVNQVYSVRDMLDLPSLQTPTMLPLALALLMRRLSAPWQLIRLAIEVAGTDDALKVANSSYAPAVQLVLDEITATTRVLREDLRRGQYDNVSRDLKSVHDSIRGIRTELDVRNDSSWGKQLAATRTDIFNTVKGIMESVPGRVRRILRQRSDKEILGGLTVDAIDVNETASIIEFLTVCRNYASELAINEVTQRTYSELQQYLEQSTQTLLGTLRGGDPRVREFRQEQVAAAVRFCGLVFGEDYATLMTKAALVAKGGAAPEPDEAKPARAS